jgi:hypothetical protein
MERRHEQQQKKGFAFFKFRKFRRGDVVVEWTSFYSQRSVLGESRRTTGEEEFVFYEQRDDEWEEGGRARSSSSSSSWSSSRSLSSNADDEKEKRRERDVVRVSRLGG